MAFVFFFVRANIPSIDKNKQIQTNLELALILSKHN